MGIFQDQHKAAKNARIARVKSLNLQIGEWGLYAGQRHIFRITKDHLDARRLDFQRLERATPGQIQERERNDAEAARLRAERDALHATPEYKIASRLAWTDTEVWLRLPLNQLDTIARILDMVSV